MSKLNQILAGGLVAQLAVVGLVWWPSERPTHEAQGLLDLEASAIDAIEITGRVEKDTIPEPIELKRSDDGWQLSSAAGYPADATKVDELIEKLVDISVRVPIADQAANHAGLDVGEKSFTRRVELSAGEREITLFVGAAPAGAAHVRMAGSDAVYSVRGLSAWSIGDRISRYTDPNYVKLEADALQSLELQNASGTVLLVRSAGSWEIPDLPEGQLLDTEAVDGLVRAVSQLRLVEPVGPDALPAHGFAGGARVSWTALVEEELVPGSYRVGAADGTSRHVQSDKGFVVLVAETSVEKALETTLDDLVVVLEPSPEEGSD